MPENMNTRKAIRNFTDSFVSKDGGQTQLAVLLYDKITEGFKVEVIPEERPHSHIMDKRLRKQRFIFRRNKQSLIEIWLYKPEDSEDYILRLLLPLNNAATYINIANEMTENVKNAFRYSSCAKCKPSRFMETGKKCEGNISYAFEGRDYSNCYHLWGEPKTPEDIECFVTLLKAEDTARDYYFTNQPVEEIKEPTLNDYFQHLKHMVVPHNAPGFSIAAPFCFDLSDAELEAGMASYRVFLHKLFDKIAASGERVANKMEAAYRGAESPKVYRTFLDAIAHVIYNIGQAGYFENEQIKRLVLDESYWASCKSPKIKKNIRELYLVLGELGFRFIGADFRTDVEYPKAAVTVEHEDDALIIGIKLIAEAQNNVPDKFAKVHNVIMRADFNPLADSEPAPHILHLYDFVYFQPPAVMEWVLDIDRWLFNNGCGIEKEKSNYHTEARFMYTIKKGKKKVTVCSIHVDVGRCFITLHNHHFTDENNVLSELPDSIQYNKSGDNDFVFTLNESVPLDLFRKWIVMEVSHA